MISRYQAGLASMAAIATGVVGVVAPSAAASPGPDADQAPTVARCTDDPQYFAYYRTWRDVHASWPDSEGDDAANVQRMDDLPAGVDVAFVFDDFVSADSEFWDVLVDEYVPNLHAQGTQVVRTVDIGVILDAPVADTPEAYADAAQALLDEYVTAHGIDGLDVDMERDLTPAQVERAAGVFTALSEHLGPQSGTERLFIYDTNKDGGHPLFARVAPYVDYVLIQSYGRRLVTLQPTWNSYAPYIEPCQYLIGFTFSEERGFPWGDTLEPFETSRAADYARWQPDGTTKGGIFSYAVDRDGKLPGDDTITASEFTWSTRLVELQDSLAPRLVPLSPQLASPVATVPLAH